MPYYGMPVGTEHEEVGFGFNKSVLTGLLRDASASTASSAPTGASSPTPRSWASRSPPARGASSTSRPPSAWRRSWMPGPTSSAARSAPSCSSSSSRRHRHARSASTSRPDACCARSSCSACSRTRTSTSRRPTRSSGAPEFRAAGDAAQRASITVLTNAIDGCRRPGAPVRPRREAVRRGPLSRRRWRSTATVVATPAEADVAILRLQAPYEQRATLFENFFHAGSLDFPAEVVAHVARWPPRCRRSSTCSSTVRRSSSRSPRRPPQSSRTGASAPKRCWTS